MSLKTRRKERGGVDIQVGALVSRVDGTIRQFSPRPGSRARYSHPPQEEVFKRTGVGQEVDYLYQALFKTPRGGQSG
jgi:hypothetical protein